MKKCIAWALALTLMLGMAAFPGAAWAAEGNRSFSLFVGLQEATINTTNNDILAWSEAQKRTGIDIEFIHGGEENFTLMIASNDLPDAIISNWNTFAGGPQAALENATILALTQDQLAQYSPNYWAYLNAWPDMIKTVTTDDGTHFQIAGLRTWEMDETKGFTPVVARAPYYESWMGPIIRRDLLEKAGLDIPVTIDDWTQALRAFKEMGVPAPMSATVGNFKTSNAFAGAYGIALDLYQDADGVAHFGPMEPGYADYVKLLNSWYKEGLLDADYAAIDGNAARAKLISGESGATIGSGSWIGTSYDGAHELDATTSFYVVAVAHPMLSKDSGLPLYGQQDYPYVNGVAVTPVCKDIETVLNFFDFYWTDEGTLVGNWGVDGVSYELNANGLPEFSAKLADNEWGYNMATMTQKSYMLNGPIPVDIRNRLFQMTLYKTPEALPCRQTWSSSQYPSVMPPYVVPTDKASDFATLGNEIKTYAGEMHVKFIMGLEPLENIEAFRQNLERIGVREYLAISQTALDNYNAR